jgi:hypothetical protein
LVKVASDEPSAGSFVVGFDVTSTNHDRPAGVADCFQCSDDGVSSPSSEISAVLKSEPTRAALSNDADRFEVEARPLAFDATAFGVGAADVLAWGTADNDGRKSSKISEKSVCRKGADIVIDLHVRVILGIEGATPSLDLARGHGGEARPMHAERPSTGGSAEEVEDFDHAISQPA